MQKSGIHEGMASSVLLQFQHMTCGLKRVWDKQFSIKVLVIEVQSDFLSLSRDSKFHEGSIEAL